ncbi:MAG: peptidase [Verrucomicrobia bacterium]|nr:peptidase [Verrucomicrobiota bacterium]
MNKRSPRARRVTSLKVLLPIGDATEVMDTMYPMFRLPEDGFEVVVAGPEARLYHGVMHEIPPTADGEPKWDITRESAAYHVRATVAFRDVDPRDYCGLFVSGGRAPEYLRYDKDLLRITRHFFDANKPVAALCHGVEILTAADCIRGRTVTTVAKCALDAQQGGATYVNEPVVISGNLVTSRVWMDNTWLLKEFVAMLKRSTGRG